MNRLAPTLRRAFTQQHPHRRIYASRPISELLNTYMIFKLCQFDWLIDNIDSVTDRGRRVMGDRLFFAALKSTMGRQFTAGESLEDALPVVRRLQEAGFDIALNYMAEFIKERNDPQLLDVNLQRYLNTFSIGQQLPGKDFFNVIKLSALIDFELLKEVNKRQVRLEQLFLQHFAAGELEAGNLALPKARLVDALQSALPAADRADLAALVETLSLAQSPDRSQLTLVEWRLGLNCFNTLNPAVAANPLYRQLLGYSERQWAEIARFAERLGEVLRYARDNGCYILADAEQSYIQAAINNFVEQLMFDFNLRARRPIVFNTVQNYLRASGRYIRYELAKLDFLGPDYPVALKLVRGAYLEEETRLGDHDGVEIVYKRKQDTDRNYNDNCRAIVARMTAASKLIVATHNKESVEQIAQIIDQSGMKEQLADRVYFASLFGLNEPLGYNCLDRGFRAIKYLPYGEREIILPYLIRRGRESKQLIQHDKDQLGVIREELLQRMKLGK